MRQAAEQAWCQRDLQQCIDFLERASRLAPADTGLLLQLGRVYGMRYNYEAAERCFERAIRVTPRKTEALAAAAQQSRDFYNTGLSQKYLQQAAKGKDATPDLLVKLAEAYERLRRVDQAGELIERALQRDSTCAAALLARARLEHRAGRLEPSEALLHSLIGKATGETRARALYELGSVLDRQARYDEAMDSFLQAKALLRADAEPHLVQLRRTRAHLAEMRDNISAALLERWFEQGEELQPARRLALLGGHPRSGTTLLEQVLDSHPDIVSAEETNNFIDYAYVPMQHRLPVDAPILDVLDSAPVELLRSCRANYIRASEMCVGSPLGKRLLIDKNPSQTFMIPGLARVFPEMKFLIALRDPRDVCLSCFMQPFVPVQQDSAGYLTLESAANEYAALMSAWRKVAPLLNNPSLEVKYEDMVENLPAVAAKALQFLGVSWEENVLAFDAHARQKVVRSPTYADVTKPVFKTAIGRWRNYQRHLAPCLEILEPFVESLGYR